MSCFCELFENETLWLIILTLLVLTLVCGNGCGNGCAVPYANNGCGCH